ncbi:hypothetical protein COOONC_16422 [Cooperia oncophora]
MPAVLSSIPLKRLATRKAKMNDTPFVHQTGISGLHPEREVRLVDDHTICQGNCDHDTHHKDQDFGDAAKEKLNNAGRAIKHTAEKIGDKAGELKDKTKQKIQEGVDAVKRNRSHI